MLVEGSYFVKKLPFFTSWHSLPEQKPLGSLNRVRKQVYTAISKYRHAKNNQPRKEPTE